MDAVQLAQMAQMEAAYAQMAAQQLGLPPAGPYGVVAPAPGPVKATKSANEYTDTDWGIPGFSEALNEAVMPINQAALVYDPDQLSAIEDIKYKVGSKILKAAKKFTSDERAEEVGTALMARALVEEFVDWSAGAVSQAFYDKPWLEKVNLAAPLLAAALHTFNGSKIFTRTLAPMLPKYVEEALFRYAEEERINKAMFDAVIASGVKDNMQKKASTHVAKAYDTAHIKAPYGSTTSDTAELGMLQDFVRGWMTEFCTIGGEVLRHGIGTSEGKPNKGDQILFLTVLFQNLTDARNAALPHELTSLIATPPPSPWAFIAETAEAVFVDVENKAREKATAMQVWKMEGSPGGWNSGKGGMGGMDMAMMEGMMGAMMGGKGGKGGMEGMEGMMQMMQMMEGGMMGGGDWGGDGGGKGGKGGKGKW